MHAENASPIAWAVRQPALALAFCNNRQPVFVTHQGLGSFQHHSHNSICPAAPTCPPVLPLLPYIPYSLLYSFKFQLCSTPGSTDGQAAGPCLGLLLLLTLLWSGHSSPTCAPPPHASVLRRSFPFGTCGFRGRKPHPHAWPRCLSTA